LKRLAKPKKGFVKGDEMVSVLIIAHGNLARELLDTVMFITGGEGVMEAIALDHNVEVEQARNMVKEEIRNIDDGGGVLIMTDLYGGAPSNICMSLQDDMKFEILAGINLPALVKAVSLQKTHDLETMAKKLKDYAKENVYLASDFLKESDEKGEGKGK